MPGLHESVARSIVNHAQLAWHLKHLHCTAGE
jgi:hypothetical protein